VIENAGLSLIFYIKKDIVILEKIGGNKMQNIGNNERLVGIVERLEVIDALYGITEEEREVLDVIRGVKDLKTESEID
jgi:hypothetical protein